MTQPSSQPTYAEALAAAAVLVAAAHSRPEPVDSLAALIRSASVATERAQQAATTRILALWRNINPYDDRAVGDFAAASGRVMVPTQQAVARITAAARTEQLRAAGVRVTVTPRIPDNVRSAAPDGTLEHRGRAQVSYRGAQREVTQRSSDTDRVFVRVAESYRYARSQGSEHRAAVQIADNRLANLVDGNLQIVRSHVEFQSMAQAHTVDLDRKIIGYRRIIHPEMSKGGVCGLCIVAADRIYKISELKAIHADCKCGVLEVFNDYDPGHQLNGADLGRLYAAAGGNTRDLLKRTRYVIEEHSELGPMLVPVKGSPVPFLSVPEDSAALVPA